MLRNKDREVDDKPVLTPTDARIIAMAFFIGRLGDMQYVGDETEARLINKNVDEPYWQMPLYNRYCEQMIGVIEISS